MSLILSDRFRNFKYRLTLIILTTIVTAAAAVSTQAWLQDDNQRKPPTDPPPAEARYERPTDGVEAEVLILRPDGFEPNEIKRPAGRFILSVRNRSGLPELSLHLARAGGEKLREVRMPSGKVRHGEPVELPPGQYTLTSEQTGAVCRITLTPR